jgi:cytochrome d ubiquinol oxidase subunit I
MNPESIARWQFGVTTVYHFLFVPLTIGLTPLVAGLETAWVRTGNVKYLRATKFWGKLMLINFILGVVTGIVQEFQFGMNWSAYSRFVGDVFGAPLAMEGLLAFFLESTFLGLWIFGWARLKPWVHCACLWIVAVGTLGSAYFILAANSWMQHPVGYEMGADGRPRLTDIWAVMFNSTQLVTFPHTMAGALMVGGAVMFGISAWQLGRSRNVDLFRGSFKLGAIVVLIGAAATAITGDMQAKIMTEQQPMKMAAAEALYNTTSGASFSVFTIGTRDGTRELFSFRLPNLLSFLATGDFTAQVEGINNVQAEYVAKFGAGNYIPSVPVTYWGFRYMIGFAMATAFVALVALWLIRKKRSFPTNKWVGRIMVLSMAGPFLGNSFGWIFTEMGRQPWSVFGLLKTADSVSPSVSATEMMISFLTLTLLYGVLAVVDVAMMARYAKAGPPSEEEVQDSIQGPKPPSDSGGADATDKALVFAY